MQKHLLIILKSLCIIRGEYTKIYMQMPNARALDRIKELDR